MSELPVKKSIYNIESEYLELMNEIEYNEGELTPELEERLAINKEDLERKSISYGYFIKTIDNDVVNIKAEIERLQRLQKREEKRAEALRERIKDAMLKHGVQKVSMNNLSLSFRKSKELIIEKTDHIPGTYKSYSTPTLIIDKKQLKSDVDSGIEIEGVTVKEKQNLQIK